MRRVFLSIPLIIAACGPVQVDPQPIGGSREDAIVNLAYEVDRFRSPEYSEARAIETATRACQIWGYSEAVRLGGEIRECSNRVRMPSEGVDSCTRSRVVIPYQCR
jgi:sigma54-dependent transcription regulator